MRSLSNQLLVVGLYAGNLTCTTKFDNFKIMFNESYYTINQAISAGFIEKFVPVLSSYTSTYEMATPLNILSGDNTGQNYWSFVKVFLNVKNVSPTKVSFYASMSSRPGDGVSVNSYNTKLHLGRTGSTWIPLEIRTITNGDLANGQSREFEYTGSSQQITLGKGRYKLYTWGAEGGTSGHGGKGGYSEGEIVINETTTLYINVGGQTGYNGGGSGHGRATDSGGGATHIAKRNGLLSTLSSYKNDVFLVAGGGGGYGGRSSVTGGYGGGLTGGVGGQRFGYHGTGGTQSSGGNGGSNNGHDGSFGQGGYNNIGSSSGGGGGGGGWYGGGAGGNDYDDYNDRDDSGGGGGSSYIGHVMNGQTTSGSREGNGKAKIVALEVTPPPESNTIIRAEDIRENWELLPDKLSDGSNNPIWSCDYEPNIHICDKYCKEVRTLVCSEPHHKGMHYDPSNRICWQACFNDANHKKYKDEIDAPDGTFTPGNFINMDYGFKVYFPNRGDFDEGEPYGIGGLTSQRGLGYIDNLDTSKWTRVKRIKFEFNVIYEDELYVAGEWITLGDRGEYQGTPGEEYKETNWSNYGKKISHDIEKNYYNFYCVLANYEAKSASMDVEVEAVNCPGPNDNLEEETNRDRGRYTALHGGSNTNYVDVVGRIGNLIIEDTGDYRFANYFKEPLMNTVQPIPEIYGTSNGMEAIDGAVVDGTGTRIIMNSVRNGATVEGINVNQGLYRIDILGEMLNNGRLQVETMPTSGESTDWSGNKFIRKVSVEVTRMSYYLTAPADSRIRITWISDNSSMMKVDNIYVTNLGDNPESWIVDGVVRDVDYSKQNHYLTWSKDIRGVDIGEDTCYVDTYGALNSLEGTREKLPLSAEKNNIDILKDDPLLVGYPIYYDISSLGNYMWNDSGQIQTVPFYYALNTVTKEITPVDVYFKYDDALKPINIHNLVSPEWDGSGIYSYVIELNWLDENVRRNYSDIEKYATEGVLRDMYQDTMVGDTLTRKLYTPSGNNYPLGNAQLMIANGKDRTFIGGETTYGQLMNLGGRDKVSVDERGRKYNSEGKIDDFKWWQSAQRWHLKVGLPSSSVFVRAGSEPTNENITEFVNENYVILCTVDIRVIGDTYILRYWHDTDNGTVRIQRKDGSSSDTIILPNNIPPVLAVYSTTKNSTYDIDIQSTH